jgi:hypothetical protein
MNIYSAAAGHTLWSVGKFGVAGSQIVACSCQAVYVWNLNRLTPVQVLRTKNYGRN